MLTDPVENRDLRFRLLKSRSYRYLSKDIIPTVDYPEEKHLKLFVDSTRVKTEAPQGKRYAY